MGKWLSAAGASRSGCQHCVEYKGQTGSGKDSEVSLERTTKAFQFLSRRRYKAPLCCLQCPKVSGWRGRLHLCLECVFIGCKDHVKEHSETTGHSLYAEVSTLHVFCSQCNDYVYDSDFEHLAEHAKSSAAHLHLPPDAARAPFAMWEPRTLKESQILAKHVSLSGLVSSDQCAGLGLRGLHNLGNTCFANSVIQSLVHNPLLRNFFLAGMHRKSPRCRIVSEPPKRPVGALASGSTRVEARWRNGSRWYPGVLAKAHDNGTYDVLYDDGDTELNLPKNRLRAIPAVEPAAKPPAESTCLGCAMNNIFHEAYNGERTQLSPHKLLYAVWQHSKHLAGYSQQDAHEFFIALLDGMHTHLGGKGGLSCDCIVHRIFTGALQSDVTCTKCDAVSTTIDQFMDVSLDIRPIAHMPTPNKYTGGGGGAKPAKIAKVAKVGKGAKKVPAAKVPAAGAAGGGSATVGGGAAAAPAAAAAVGGLSPTRAAFEQQTTLEDCLLRYTRTERLMSEITCGKCGDRQPATKQMSFSKLPAVLCFHLKRFEHDAHAAKISTSVRFPESLDMRPFLSQVINGKVEGAAAEAMEDLAHTDDTYAYTLFSVVNHYGTLQNGHYTNYIRSADVDGQWFLCNDETVTMAPLSDVLLSEGYMLFYVKKRLEYTAT